MPDEITSLKKKVVELEEINRRAQSLSTNLNVYETLETIADCCTKLCGVERASILLIHPSGNDALQPLVRREGGPRQRH